MALIFKLLYTFIRVKDFVRFDISNDEVANYDVENYFLFDNYKNKLVTPPSATYW